MNFLSHLGTFATIGALIIMGRVDFEKSAPWQRHHGRVTASRLKNIDFQKETLFG